MSVGRIGTRAAIVGLSVLVSVALMAAPSWAAKEKGNGLCARGAYPGALFAQDGSAFKNTRACAKYVAKGGQLGGVDAVAEPPVRGSFKETCTGFGLAPSTTVAQEYRCGATYSNGDFTGQYGPVGADGTWSVSTNPPCTLAGGTVVSLQVVALDLEGSTVEREFPPPSGC
jgi:hypothetical protein